MVYVTGGLLAPAWLLDLKEPANPSHISWGGGRVCDECLVVARGERVCMCCVDHVCVLMKRQMCVVYVWGWLYVTQGCGGCVCVLCVSGYRECVGLVCCTLIYIYMDGQISGVWW